MKSQTQKEFYFLKAFQLPKPTPRGPRIPTIISLKPPTVTSHRTIHPRSCPIPTPTIIQRKVTRDRYIKDKSFNMLGNDSCKSFKAQLPSNQTSAIERWVSDMWTKSTSWQIKLRPRMVPKRAIASLNSEENPSFNSYQALKMEDQTKDACLLALRSLLWGSVPYLLIKISLQKPLVLENNFQINLPRRAISEPQESRRASPPYLLGKIILFQLTKFKLLLLWLPFQIKFLVSWSILSQTPPHSLHIMNWNGRHHRLG